MQMPPSVRSEEKYLSRLVEINSRERIPTEWLDTPIEAFIMSQNFGWPIQTTGNPELLISTCMEFRYALPMPRMYAYVIRRASGRVIGSEFSVGYTLAKGVRYLIMIGHNDCGMTRVEESIPKVVEAFVEQGWRKETAQEYVRKHADRHAIDDELEALEDEYARISPVFPKLVIAPLFVCMFDNKLYLPNWYEEVSKNLASKPKTNGVPDELVFSLP
jgi:hypothetical protein